MILEETFTLANGVKIPKLGLGVWMIPDHEVAGIIRDAVEIGYRHVDTAQAYANERGVGEALRLHLVAAGVALPFPAGIGRVAPAVGVGELEAAALEGAGGEPGVGVDALEPFQRAERFPGLPAGLFLARDGVTRRE